MKMNNDIKTRYEYLPQLIEMYKPSSIMEIGVHEGRRAMYMVREARKWSLLVDYRGFDVFETESEEFQKAALNGKGMPSENKARRAIKSASDEFPGSITWNLHVGRTSENLHKFPIAADFVFIDGDHRADVIAKDYEAVAKSKVVVFDDYYRVAPDGSLPDLTKYGANRVVDRIQGAKVLAHGDPCRDGGLAHIAVVVR